MSSQTKLTSVVNALAVLFLLLTAAFILNLWGRPDPRPPIALVDPSFTNTATWRTSAADLYKTGGDTSGLECYVCHDKKNPVKIKFDTNGVIILPQEHADLKMGHGRHNRNNNCYNCHNENNLELLQTRDGHELSITNAPALCGSCHGPTYRDWEAGVHGRTSGFWKREMGPIDRKVCTSCHDPHSPKFPGRKPAPAPHALREPLLSESEPKH